MALLLERGLPPLEGALSLEERVGSISLGELRIGPLALLRQLAGSSKKAVRSLPDGAPAVLAASWTADEVAYFVDAAGAIHRGAGERLWPEAGSIDAWIEKLALATEALAAPSAVIIEVAAPLGEPLARALRLGLVGEASDAASSWWRSGEVVAEVPALEPRVTLRALTLRSAAHALEAVRSLDRGAAVRVRAARPPPATPLVEPLPAAGSAPLRYASSLPGESGRVWIARRQGRVTIEQVAERPTGTSWETFADGGHTRREQWNRR